MTNIDRKELNLMKKEKMAEYNLTTSIHTVTIRTKDKPFIPNGYDHNIVRSAYLQRTGVWSLRINPNKVNKDLCRYSEFNAAICDLCEKMRIGNVDYYRCDIRNDSYEDNFKEYYKLNLLLINLFCILLNDPNGQPVSHYLTRGKTFSDISTQNSYWQVKYYDKKFQTNDKDPAKARLEFRTLRNSSKKRYTPDELKEEWFKKLDKLPGLYERLQEQCNEDLYGAYLEYLEYNSKSNFKRDPLTGFLSAYQNAITVFTRKQLKEFLLKVKLDVNPQSRANYIIDKTRIEFFSKTDIQRYVEKIKKAMEDFFSC